MTRRIVTHQKSYMLPRLYIDSLRRVREILVQVCTKRDDRLASLHHVLSLGCPSAPGLGTCREWCIRLN